MTIIGETQSASLSDIGILTIDDLLGRALTIAERQVLADELGVRERVVSRWAHAAELTRIVGLGIPQANLLVIAGVGGISELSNRDAGKLSDDLSAFAVSIDADSAPDSSDVQSWVDQSQPSSLPLIVEYA